MTLLVTTISFGQQESQAVPADLFAQGMLNLESDQEMIDLEQEMRLNPNLQVVRLDRNSNRFFILTYDVAELSEEDMLSWFGSYAELVTCIQIGVHGVDTPNPFPFTNCPN